MPTYLHPGVYIEEIPSGVKTIEGVGTSTAAFVGYTTKGPLNDPRLIFNFDDYVRRYGGLRDHGAEELGDAMGFSVAAFFQNGGTKAYIARLAKDSSTANPSRPLAKAKGGVTPPASLDLLDFTAIDEGAWANDLVVQVSLANRAKPSDSQPYKVEVGRWDDLGKPQEKRKLLVVETFSGVTLVKTDPRFVESAINGVSQNVTVELTAGAGTPPASPPASPLDPPPPTWTMLAGGGDGEAADAGAYDAVFSKFLKIRDLNILCLPGRQWNSAGKPFLEKAIAHAEATGRTMVLIDPPDNAELTTEKSVNDLDLPTSTYTALYYPWIRVANPFYDEEDNPGVQPTLLVPPSGFAAGMWSKIDGRRGVWKAPAGVETQLLGVASLRYVVEDAEQDQLNPLGVNALRKLSGFGHVIWGSRTLSTKANPEWRYVPVRRTAIFLEQSIYNSIQWAVFEPNDHGLWSSLRVNIDSFMNGLFRSGAFQGEKASDAYFVRCGLGDTMTQGDIDRGQVIVVVGFAPLKPAEFVIVRIQQKVAQQ